MHEHALIASTLLQFVQFFSPLPLLSVYLSINLFIYQYYYLPPTIFSNTTVTHFTILYPSPPTRRPLPLTPCPLPLTPHPFPLTPGKVAPGSTQRVVFTVRPATPCTIVEKFSVKIAYFEEIVVTCCCVSVFPAVVVGLPRQKRAGEK